MCQVAGTLNTDIFTQVAHGSRILTNKCCIMLIYLSSNHRLSIPSTPFDVKSNQKNSALLGRTNRMQVVSIAHKYVTKR